MAVGEELCDRFLKGDYQYVLSVHTDKDHIHCHIIFNNTNLYNGLSFNTEHNQGKVSERAWAKLREISDEICKEHGLSVIEHPEKGQGVSHFERDMQIQGKSWKDKLRSKIAEVAFYSKSFEDFLQNCEKSGIEYVYTPRNKVKLKFRLKDEGQQRFTRADTLGEEYTPERIAEQIEQIQKDKAVTEKKAAEKPITQPKPIVAPKTEPAPKAEPTQSEYVYKPPTDEEFFRAFGVHPDEVAEPAPIESKPTEKKADPWANIRGMGRANEIIADLESVGIKSYSEFSGFMWDTHHADDHTAELAELQTQIEDIEKLIKMMKQRSKHSKTYKEYQDCSAFWQKRFRKKNAESIDSYEKADKYIKEHIKDYYVNGKAPKISELQAMSERVKLKFNSLVPEHNSFIEKSETAHKYVSAVRHYINEKTNREAAEKSRQRKLTQQRKKDTLE